jgi:hypothetical protein
VWLEYGRSLKIVRARLITERGDWEGEKSFVHGEGVIGKNWRPAKICRPLAGSTNRPWLGAKNLHEELKKENWIYASGFEEESANIEAEVTNADDQRKTWRIAGNT